MGLLNIRNFACPPTTLREDTSAVLNWITKAVDGGTATLQDDGYQLPQKNNNLGAGPDTTQAFLASVLPLAGQGELKRRVTDF